MKKTCKITLMLVVMSMCLSTINAQKSADNALTDKFVTEKGTEVLVCPIKHGSVRVKMADSWIYIDPVGKGIAPATDYSLLPPADVILITHNHGDHLDADAIAQLTKDNTLIYANAASHELLGKGNAMAAGESVQLSNGVLLKAVPAYNTSKEHQKFHPQGRDNGYLLTVDGFTVYIAGDTEVIPEMENLGHVDVAFLPCNQPYTMTPEQLAQAARLIRPRVLYPYHCSNTDLSSLPSMLEGLNIDLRIR